MKFRIEKAQGTGFCFGVKRAIETLERVARERGHVETLGEVVHNEQVLQRLAGIGVRVANSIDDIRQGTVAIGAHGVDPRVEQEIRARHGNVINTTCPFVHRAQITARKLAKLGFFVLVYGDADHVEVKGILGWAGGKGMATLKADQATLNKLPRHIGLLSQTTQIPANFIEFVKDLVSLALVKDAELRVIDTICHDIRTRQIAAIELARRANLMLVIGSHTSANTKHLAELCSGVTRTRLVETAADIEPSWLEGYDLVGVTGGASTSEETINEVMAKLETLSR